MRPDEPSDLTGLVADVTHDAKVYMPLAELVDIEKEKARLTKDLGRKPLSRLVTVMGMACPPQSSRK